MPRSLVFLQKMAEGRKDSPGDQEIVKRGEGENLHNRELSSDSHVPGEQSPNADLRSNAQGQSDVSQSSLQEIIEQGKSSSSIAEEGSSSTKIKLPEVTPGGATAIPGHSNIDYWRKALWFERSEKKKLQEQAMVDKMRAVEYVKKLKFEQQAALEKSKGFLAKRNATLQREADLFKERYKHAVSETKSLSLDLYESVVKSSKLQERCQNKEAEVQKLTEHIERLVKQMDQNNFEPGNVRWHSGQLLKAKEINLVADGASLGETMPVEAQRTTEVSCANSSGDGEAKPKDLSGFEEQDDDPDDNAILRCKIKVLKNTVKKLRKEITGLKRAMRSNPEKQDMGSRWKLEVALDSVQSFWGEELTLQVEKDIISTNEVALPVEAHVSFEADYGICETTIPENRPQSSELSMHVTNQFVRAEDMVQTEESRSELLIELSLDLTVCAENNLSHLQKVLPPTEPLAEVPKVVEDENVSARIDDDRSFVGKIISYLIATITCYVTTITWGLIVRLVGPRGVAILTTWWTFGCSTYTFGRGFLVSEKRNFIKGRW